MSRAAKNVSDNAAADAGDGMQGGAERGSAGCAKLGEPITLANVAIAARWHAAEDGGWLELDEELMTPHPSLNLHLLWRPGRLEAHWVMGCGLLLGDAKVGLG